MTAEGTLAQRGWPIGPTKTARQELCLVLLGAALTACGGRAPAARPATPPPSRPTPIPAPSKPPVSIRSLDELASRGALDAPMMREAQRVDVTSGAVEIDTKAGDTCVRATITSARAGRAWFEDDKHVERAEPLVLSSPAQVGVVPPRGPVCVRRGETLRLILGDASAAARVVIWQSP